MSYSIEVFNKAEEILAHRREQAEASAEFRLEEISEKIPELLTIKKKLGQIGLSISRVFFESSNKQSDIEKLKEASLELQEQRKNLLIKNGYDENALEVQYTCSHCKDTGIHNNRICKCHTELLKSIERENLQKHAPLDECTFESFNTLYYPEEPENGISPRAKAESILNNCKRYASKFTSQSPSILFMGGTGLGKTHLSLAIANAVIDHGYSVEYGTAQNILNDLSNENFGRTDRLKYTEERILECDLLILDDLGTEFKTSYSIACLYNIINTRLSAKLPTIISTNFSQRELEEKYDQRITSRITGEYNTLILLGKDIRYIK